MSDRSQTEVRPNILLGLYLYSVTDVFKKVKVRPMSDRSQTELYF